MNVSVNTVEGGPDVTSIEICGFTGPTAVPVSANDCVVELAEIFSVAVRAPVSLGVNCAVTVQPDFDARPAVKSHVVVHGNSETFVSVTDVTGTDVEPLLKSVITTGVLAVEPRPVTGNASVGHVMMKFDAVVVDDGEVVLLEQPAASSTRR